MWKMFAEIAPTLATLLVVSVISHILYIVLRNRRAHRFFKIHSPNLPVAPNPSWFSGHAFDFVYGARNWVNIGEQHKKLGKTFGIYVVDKPIVSTTDLELIKRIVIDEPDKHPNRVTLSVLCDELEIDCIFTTENDHWRRLRRSISPAFSSHRIKSANVQAEIKSVIDKFVTSIERRLDTSWWGIEINADDLFQRYSLALVFSSFYKQDGIIDFDRERDDSVSEVDSILRSFKNPFLNVSLTFPIFRPILLWLVNNFHPQGCLRAKILDYIKRQTRLNQRAKQTIEAAKLAGQCIDEDNVTLSGGQEFRRNMVDYIIDQYHSGKMRLREFLHSTFFLFFAANKTSADALAKIFYLLAAHQDVQDKLREAILRDGAAGEYVNWVILEAMRIYPPGLLGCTRTISSDEYTITGHLIPAGTTVLTPAFTIHRLKEYWGEDADEFRPERWANAKNFHPCQYMAFGAGKRYCPGKDYALHEMRLLLAEMILKFKFEKSTKSQGFLTFYAPILVFTVPDEPTHLRISRLRT